MGDFIKAMKGRILWHHILKKHGKTVAYVMGEFVSIEYLQQLLKHMPEFVTKNQYDYWIILYTADNPYVNLLASLGDRAICISQRSYCYLEKYFLLTNRDKRFIYCSFLLKDKGILDMMNSQILSMEEYIINGVLQL